MSDNRGGKWDGRPLGKDAPHYPNKKESKIIRQLMVKAGETKEEILAKKENRQLIAKELKGKQSDSSRRLKFEINRAKRWIAQKLKLPVYSNEVIEEFNKSFEIYYGRLRYKR